MLGGFFDLNNENTANIKDALMTDAVVMETSLETFPVRRGKVRDIYDM